MRAGSAEPPAQRFDGGLGLPEVTQPECVDDAPLLIVETDGHARGQREIAAADGEGVGGKSVPSDRSLGPWVPVTARESDVDAGWDRIGQPVSGQRRGQAQCGARRSVRDLQQIWISVADRVSPLEQTATELLDQSGVAEGIQPPIRQAARPRLGVGERRWQSARMLSRDCLPSHVMEEIVYTLSICVYGFIRSGIPMVPTWLGALASAGIRLGRDLVLTAEDGA